MKDAVKSELRRIPHRKPAAGKQRIYSERQVKLIDPVWVVDRVPRGFWDDEENCRNYLFWLAHKLHFGHMEQWYECTDAQFYDNRGESLLKRHGWSRAEVVKAYFSGYEWYDWLFLTTPRGFWHKAENRKRYYAWLGRQLGFRKPADWWRLTCDDLWNNHGTTLFNILPSLADVRKECCPEMEREWERRKPVTAEQILRWADEHFARHAKWPNARSGPVQETGTTWGTVNYLLRRGMPGVPAGTTLARFLMMRRGRIHHLDRPRLSIPLILRWADSYFKLHGAWPKRGSGRIEGAEATWCGIDSALWKGARGLPGGTSLGRLLKERRGN
jgi:hypothetical protein